MLVTVQEDEWYVHIMYDGISTKESSQFGASGMIKEQLKAMNPIDPTNTVDLYTFIWFFKNSKLICVVIQST